MRHLGASVKPQLKKDQTMSTLAVNLISSFVSVYTILILAAVVLSWVRPAGGLGRVWEAVDSLTGPYLRIFRRCIPPVGRRRRPSQACEQAKLPPLPIGGGWQHVCGHRRLGAERSAGSKASAKRWA